MGMPADGVRLRGPQVEEMIAARKASEAAEYWFERAYWRGVYLGYAYAAGPGAEGLRWSAGPFEGPLTWEEACIEFTTHPSKGGQYYPGVWQRAGLEHGYKQATAELPDVYECPNCQARTFVEGRDCDGCDW